MFSKFKSRPISHAARICFIAGVLAWLPAASFGANYYVATNGVDVNPGTLAQPFLTIQRAANVMVAGDTAYIRGGIYRRTVTPSNSGTAASPITYRPYSNEVVTVSGADVVTGWTVYSNGIYKATFTGALGDKDQVFVDSQMMNLARWPNTSPDVSRPVKAVATAASVATTNNSDGSRTASYADAALTQPAGFLNGAKIHFVPGYGVGWISQTGGYVTNSTPGSITFRWPIWSTNLYYTPQAGNPYFLFGLLSLLDTPGEWFIDTNLNQMYLWPPLNDSPTSHTVEAKQRDYGFDLSGKSYITVQGLRLFACAVNSSSTSKGLVLDGLQCLYVSHYSLVPNGWGLHTEDSGIVLSGTSNILRNSSIAYSAGNGLTLLGTKHLVDNCVIHDVDYAGADDAAINTGGTTTLSTGHEIRNTTCYNSARGLVMLRALTAGKVHHNVLYRPMLRTTDGGVLYCFGHDGQNTEIAYNRISDSDAANHAASSIYLDNNSTNFIVHHNLIYNSCWGLSYNPASVNVQWFNNTAAVFYKSYGSDLVGSQANTVVRNNIFTAPYVIATTNLAEVVFSNNITNTVDPLFVSTNGLDFRLQSNSPAVDAGFAISPYTDGYSGTAPDIGAFEYGQPAWVAGSTLTNVPPAGPTDLAAIVAGSGILLTWIDHATNETQYVIDRSLDNYVYTELAHLPANTTNYTDFTVQKGSTYYYRVRADESANSNYRSVVDTGHDAISTIHAWLLDAQNGGLNVVTGCCLGSCDNNDWAEYAATDFGAGASTVSMQLNIVTVATNLYIEVRLDSVTGPRIANINVPAFVTGNNTNVTVAITNTTGIHDLYIVFKGGFGVCNFGDFSFAQVTAQNAPPIPQSLAAAPVLQSQMQVTWAPTNGAQAGFSVERSCDNQNFVVIGTAAAATNAFFDSGLPGGTTGYYRVRSYNRLGFSGYSATAAATAWTARESWRYQYFGTISNTGNAADNADPDGDGMVNLFEYAVNRNPLVADAAGAFTGQLDNTGKLQVTFFRARAELNYTVQVSGDLATWTDLITNPGSVGQNVTVTEAPPGATQRFMRLRVNP